MRDVFVSGVVAAAFVLLFALSALAEVKLPGIISDGMVIQRGAEVRIWGWADDGEKVTVGFRGRMVSAIAKDGKWSVALPPMKAGGPHTMIVSGKNTVEVKDILVGDVWVCSGQSNMQWIVAQLPHYETYTDNCANPKIRLFTVPMAGADRPKDDVESSWKPCNPANVAAFSAVGYFFGRDLQKALGIPIGLINSSVGGTAAEAWTRASYAETRPELKAIFEEYRKSPEGATWRPGQLYNHMIAPLTSYPVKGVIWYQGESNAGRADRYLTLLTNMIRNWREDWGCGDFPFLVVQLAPFGPRDSEDESWARLREAQLMVTKALPKVGVAVTTDVGDEIDVHPLRKEPVGVRLALAAQGIAYGRRIAYSGPIYKSMKIDGDRIVLRFKHVGKGLESGDGELAGFRIAGADGKFKPAKAVIERDTVLLSSPDVPRPVAARYGWANFPVCNLWNKDGLPAAPFRTSGP